MKSNDPDTRVDLAWTQLCRRLETLGNTVLTRARDNPIDQAEGLRYLTRALRYALILQFEAGDPDFPRFVRSGSETLKFFGDSPDYYYLLGTIAGANDYCIRGTRGAAEVLAFSTYAHTPAGVICTGELAVPKLTVNADGSFVISVSAAPQPGNWLPMEPNTSFMQVRNMFRDHHRRHPGEVHIERIGGPRYPAPFTADLALAALRRVDVQSGAMLDGIVRFQERLLARAGINVFDHDQSTWQSIGGAKSTYYVQALYELGENEALIVESDVPDCSYFSFQLNNAWMESLDYGHRRVYGSLYTTERNADGGVTFIIAARDPGGGNWLDTCGRQAGSMLWKWNHAAKTPQPTVRRVNLDGL